MRMRAPVPEDAPAVLGVIVARDLADVGVADYTLEDLLGEWRGGGLDVGADTIVAVAGAEIVGYAAVHQRSTMAVVAPEHEDRGIGARLLAWAERREAERGRKRHRQWVAAGNTRAQALLLGAGYLQVRSAWRMVRALDHGVDAGAPQAAGAARGGFELRPLDVERDGPTVHALDDASFAGAADYEPETFETFRAQHLAAYDLDPDLSRVAEREGRIAGFLLAMRREDTAVGYVDILAVHPGHQRQGIGTALLLDAFRRFAAVGLREAQLSVASDNPRALALYERLGMTARVQRDNYERPVLARP
jgi:mycothiol synthase